ncbi:V-type proton ATPase catalytic subunit A [Platysternon megacephalum]|uniref:V-type proton ATPase catalytic subunit A n=1 Tax=Platysternon megacephalum TaxID=55544 RepID=A0A4D9E4N9_9SAUR|nr:V-type proton ATPase catalytic subunit A [Platysternon megacephalum]
MVPIQQGAASGRKPVVTQCGSDTSVGLVLWRRQSDPEAPAAIQLLTTPAVSALCHQGQAPPALVFPVRFCSESVKSTELFVLQALCKTGGSSAVLLRLLWSSPLP